jgi:hypothetical protein
MRLLSLCAFLFGIMGSGLPPQGGIPLDSKYDLLCAFYRTYDVAAGEPGAFDYENWTLLTSASVSKFTYDSRACNLSLTPQSSADIAKISRELNVNISGYCALRLGGWWSPSGIVRVRLWVDDHPPVMQEFLKTTSGSPMETFKMPLQGGILHKIELEIAATNNATTVTISPAFFQLQKSVENVSLINPITVLPVPENERILRPQGRQPLRWGVVMKLDELAAFRAALTNEPLAGLLQRQTDAIAPYLSLDVAKEVNDSSSGIYLRLYGKESNSPDLWNWGMAPNDVLTAASMVYLATGDLRYAELARQLILAISRVKYWTNSFIYRYPEPNESKSFAPFAESSYAMDVALALDWTADYLTEAEILEVQNALHGKAVPHIAAYLDAQDSPTAFWRTSNQGMIFNGGLLLAAMVQSESCPDKQQLFTRADQNLQEVIPLQQLADGTPHEGLSYWNTSMVYGGIPMLAMANATNLSFAQRWGGSLAETMKFLAYCKSNAGDGTLRMFNFSDSTYSTIFGGRIPFFLVDTDPVARWILSLTRAAEQTSSRYNLLNMMLLSRYAEYPAPSINLPLRRKFDTSQIVFWRGGWEDGDPNFTFISGPVSVGHHHADKNSLTLEYAGDRLLVDPGMISYSDTRSQQLGLSEWHNTISVGAGSQSVATADPAAVLTSYSDTNSQYGYLSSDATRVYTNALSAKRTVYYSDTQNILVCVDDVTLKTAQTIAVNWQTLSPFQYEESTGQFRQTQTHSQLLMDVSSASNRLLNASQDTFISDSGELYRLRFASGSPGVNDRIVSVFAFGSTNDTVRIVRNSSSEYTVRTGAGWYVIQVDQGGTPVISVQPLQTQKIQNGDFENGTNGWTVSTGGETGAVLATNTAAQSPFSSGSAGFQMTDGTANASQYIINDFGAQADGKYNLSFDYKMLAANNALWLGRIRNSGSSDISFDFSIGNTYLKVGATSVAAGLSTGTWYHVSMILDSAADKVLSGFITPYGGSATTWGEIAGYAITAQIKQLMILDTAGPTVAPSIYLDNIRLDILPE